jgi:hypothetical protein
MGKAKTASKNNPAGRVKSEVIQHNGKVAKPVRFIGEGRKYMAIGYDDGSMPYGQDGWPLPWASVRC